MDDPLKFEYLYDRLRAYQGMLFSEDEAEDDLQDLMEEVYEWISLPEPNPHLEYVYDRLLHYRWLLSQDDEEDEAEDDLQDLIGEVYDFTLQKT
jgi:hypothetical protein